MQKIVLAASLIFFFHIGCSQSNGKNQKDSPPAESFSEFDQTDPSVIDAKLKIFLKRDGDKFRIASIDVSHEYDAEKRTVTPVFDSATVAKISERVLELFNSNIEIFNAEASKELHPCVKVHLECAKIIAEVPQLPERGCECKCRNWPGTGWGIWFVCPDEVG